MHQRHQVSEFVMSLGRTLPSRMRVDRIEANGERVILSGTLLEPAEEASISLGRYMETLRRTPEIGGMFSSISTTSLQRSNEGDALVFEITLRLRPGES
jgi:hypothetical protein